ncbi:MAG: dephospho-CoA kinase [Actinobacteria bacterium]|nr:dephospho-CoA kinase [Actinomycetota bacterium]
MFVVALTGGIASGKSTVCNMLARKGAFVICSDVLAREVVEKEKPAWKDIVAHFGDEILDQDGEIDRAKLAEIVFADAEERVFLEGVTHPRIFQRMAETMREIDAGTGGDAVVILDIPLLVEARAGGMFDYNLVVDASPQVQVERLMADRGSTEEEAWARMNAQVPREERLACADLVIHNEGNIADLQQEVDKAWETIGALARRGR